MPLRPDLHFGAVWQNTKRRKFFFTFLPIFYSVTFRVILQNRS